MAKAKEEARVMEEKRTAKEKEKDPKERAIRVEWWGTHPENAPRVKQKEEKEIGDPRARQKEREDLQDNATPVENGGIQRNIVPRERANPREE